MTFISEVVKNTHRGLIVLCS